MTESIPSHPSAPPLPGRQRSGNAEGQKPPAGEDRTTPHLLLSLDGLRLALPVAMVERVVRAVAITPLPEAPAAIAGVINVEGRILPVIDLRQRLGLPGRPLSTADRMVILATPNHAGTLICDLADQIVAIPPHTRTASPPLDARRGSLPGMTIRDDEIILIAEPDILFNCLEGLGLPDAEAFEPPEEERS